MRRHPRFDTGLPSLLMARAPYPQVAATISEILDFVETRDPNTTVSCDTVVAIVRARGFPLDCIQAFDNRLRLLHWMAMEGAGVHVPILGRKYRKAIDAYDHEVFWDIAAVLLGAENVDWLFQLSWPEKLSVCLDLRREPGWMAFVERYRAIVEIAAEERDGLDKGRVLEELRRVYPGCAKYVWSRTSKIQLAMLGISVGSFALSMAVAPFSVLSAVGVIKVVSMLPIGYSAKRVYKNIVAACKEYVDTDLVAFRHELRAILSRFRLQRR